MVMPAHAVTDHEPSMACPCLVIGIAYRCEHDTLLYEVRHRLCSSVS